MKPIVSIIMPTFNSEKTIIKSLESIRKQDYPQNSIDIMIIDGGSTDKTREIAKKYNARIVENIKVQQEYAKHIGLTQGKGKYGIFLDSDEVFESSKAISNRINLMENNQEIKVVLSGGYLKPKESASINDYINYFGDPFSYFMYGTSFNWKSWKSKFPNNSEKEKYIEFNFNKGDLLPLIDMCAGNTMDLEYFREKFKDIIEDFGIVPKIFYLIIDNTNKAVILKDDYIIHYSADSLKKYFKKIRWRVVANIHYVNIPGTGFVNRDEFQSIYFRYKKYLFIPFAFSIILPFFYSLVSFIKIRKPIVFIHIPLTVYTAYEILYQYSLKLLGIKPTLRTYGNETKKLNL